MGKIIIIILLTFVIKPVSAKENCFSFKELYDRAEEENYYNMPSELLNSRVDLENTSICDNDSKEVLIITNDKNATARHLVATGLYFGYGFLGGEGTYTRLNTQGGYKDHFRLMGHYFPDLWGGAGIQYSKHISGSKFYIGTNVNYIRVFDQVNNYAAGAVIGVTGGKSFVSGFLQIGIRTAIEGDLIETMPQIGFGIRFRILRR